MDLSEDGNPRTLIAQTTDRASDYEQYRQVLADMMASLEFSF